MDPIFSKTNKIHQLALSEFAFLRIKLNQFEDPNIKINTLVSLMISNLKLRFSTCKRYEGEIYETYKSRIQLELRCWKIPFQTS